MIFNMTVIIIIITVVISYLTFRSPSLLEKLVLSPYRIKHHHEYYRFITSGFIHANWIHLLINMFVLYSFGAAVEILFEIEIVAHWKWYFIALYFGAIIFSDIATFFKHKNNMHFASLGASGAVSGVLFAFVLFRPVHIWKLYAVIPIPGIVAAILYLIYSAYQAKRSSDNINHDAHFYGAIFGFCFTWMLKPSLIISFYDQLINWL